MLSAISCVERVTKGQRGRNLDGRNNPSFTVFRGETHRRSHDHKYRNKGNGRVRGKNRKERNEKRMCATVIPIYASDNASGKEGGNVKGKTEREDVTLCICRLPSL